MSENKEVDFSNIAWKLLGQWKIILVFALVCGLIIGGYKTYDDAKNANVEMTITEEEKENVQIAQNIDAQIRVQKNYKEESLLMNVDPYNIEVTYVTYAVELEESAAENVIELYTSYIRYGNFYDDLIEAMQIGISREYLAEIVNITEDTRGNSYVFTIEVIHTDKVSVDDLKQNIDNALEVYEQELNRNLLAHSLIKLEDVEREYVDYQLWSQQNSLKNSITSLENQLNNLQNNFTEAQWLFYKNAEIVNMQQKSVSIVSFLGGIVIGIVVYVIVYSWLYLINSNIKSAQEIERVLGIKNLGEVREYQYKKIATKMKEDYKVHCLRYRECLDIETQIKNLICRLTSICKTQNMKDILFVTLDELTETEKGYLNRIISEVGEKEINIRMLTHHVSEEVYDSILNYKNIVVILLQEKTPYGLVDNCARTCELLKCNIIGTITLDLKKDM